ncbi:AMP-binding protein [Streptomyces sp. DSM 44915]|uniref:AMP-binding protein n=1 Tax=Streptomyces chisholmiae TaxID=3075540 RepID=A0ABU2JQF6_9ACTN|nr:AMP-binding protein [Streptomyces sp. DSM 44915]MDT0267221.1 AMP-binding protein [Streptomyces sp. DSM 44915]
MSASPVFRNYAEIILDGLNDEPGHPVVVAGTRRLTAAEFRSLVYRMARVLRERGVGPGRTVTLLCGNLPETIAVRYAVNLLGAHFNHLYNRLGTDVQAAMMADVETHALVVDPRLAGRAAELIRAVPPMAHVLLLGDDPEDVRARGDSTPGGLGDDLLALAGKQPGAPLPSGARPDDLCFIRHSGGTTGHPKGVRSTFGRMQAGIALTRQLFSGTGRRDLVCTPLSHAAGFIADGTLSAGGTVVLHYAFDPADILATIERERITNMMLLPPLLYQLLDHPDVEQADTSSLRQLTYGGTPSSPVRISEAVRRFGPVLQQGYGQFEAGAVSVLSAAEHDPNRPDLLRTAGRPVPGVEVEIRDEAGRVLPVGEVGEICVRSEQVMEGYWKSPGLTAQVLRDGWLHTGDLGLLDAHGYLRVVDRIRDMIVVVGGHVYTTELEDFLNTHPAVRQSAVYGVKGDSGHERVHATVCTDPAVAVTADDLRTWVSEGRGAMYEPDHIDFTEALPLTDAGKPDKKLLRRRGAQAGNQLT